MILADVLVDHEVLIEEQYVGVLYRLVDVEENPD
jgi:hypothetical protein